jgi:Lon protease-like protein
VQHICLPAENEKDWSELPDHVRAGITPHFCEKYDDVYAVAFPTEEELEAERQSRRAKKSANKPAVGANSDIDEADVVKA